MARIAQVVMMAAALSAAMGCAGLPGPFGTGGGTASTDADARIRAAVESGLSTDRLRSALTEVDVRTTDAVVRLSGSVPNETAKRRATEIAENVSGVRQVVNNIRTDPDARSEARTQNDDRITAAIEHRFATDPARSTLTAIDVATASGTVTLTGTVPSETAKRRATELAREVSGVRGVVDRLRTTAGDAPSRTYIRSRTKQAQ